MSQATTYIPSPAAGTTRHGVGFGFRTLLAALLLTAAGGMLATTLFDRTGEAVDAPRLPPAPSALPVMATTGSTTVPDASAVFAGREIVIEEPAPTF